MWWHTSTAPSTSLSARSCSASARSARQRRPRVDRRRRGAQARGQRAPSPSSSPSSRPSRRPTSPPARRRSKGSPDPVRPVGAFIRGGADCNPAGQPFVVEVRPAMGRAAAFSKPRSTRPARAPVTAKRSLYLQSGCSSWEIALVASPSGRVPLRKVKKPTVASLDGRTLRQDRSSRPYDPNTSPRSCGVLACASPPRAAFRTERFLDGVPSRYAWRLALPRRAVRRDGDACRARGAPPAPGTTFRVRRSRTGRTATSPSCRPSAPGCSPAAAGRVVPPLARGHLAGSRRVDWGGERR